KQIFLYQTANNNNFGFIVEIVFVNVTPFNYFVFLYKLIIRINPYKVITVLFVSVGSIGVTHYYRSDKLYLVFKLVFNVFVILVLELCLPARLIAFVGDGGSSRPNKNGIRGRIGKLFLKCIFTAVGNTKKNGKQQNGKCYSKARKQTSGPVFIDTLKYFPPEV